MLCAIILQKLGARLVVNVIEKKLKGSYYQRKVYLADRDGTPFSIGIISLDLSAFDEAMQQEILSEAKPFGRILEDRGLNRNVHLRRLFQVNDVSGICSGIFGDMKTKIFGRHIDMTVEGAECVSVYEFLNPYTLDRS